MTWTLNIITNLIRIYVFYVFFYPIPNQILTVSAVFTVYMLRNFVRSKSIIKQKRQHISYQSIVYVRILEIVFLILQHLSIWIPCWQFPNTCWYIVTRFKEKRKYNMRKPRAIFLWLILHLKCNEWFQNMFCPVIENLWAYVPVFYVFWEHESMLSG